MLDYSAVCCRGTLRFPFTRANYERRPIREYIYLIHITREKMFDYIATHNLRQIE